MIQINDKPMTLTSLSGWSESVKGNAYVINANSVEDLKKILFLSQEKQLNILVKGAGCSYGDEVLNDNNLVINTQCMDKIKTWCPDSGVMVVEPGVTFEHALQHSLRDGWIIPAIPGTRFPTIGGALANNVHGKNSYKEGNFGECAIGFEILLASGEIIACSEKNNSELFYSAIGGLGLLGVFIEVTLQLKRVTSAYFQISKWTEPNLQSLICGLDQSIYASDYVIGQVDCFPKGINLGRGTIHTAVESDGQNRDTEERDNAFSKILSAMSKPHALNVAKLVVGDFSMMCISSLKFYFDKLSRTDNEILEDFFNFNFLLDKIPNWKHAFKYGFVEHESLLPKEKATAVFEELIKLTHRFNMPAYLGAIKVHRKDDFLLSFSMDGYSLGIDIPYIPDRKDILHKLLVKLNEVVLENGGLTYLAKDSYLSANQFKSMYKGYERFKQLKEKYDPQAVFQSNMYRRLFIADDIAL